ncbi:ParA family protein, partial [Arthrobacter deserti]|nr:ParA family protein [Arthrobacter deserti]
SEHMYRMAEMRTMFGELLLEPTIAEQSNWQQIQGAAHSIHQWPGESARQAAAVFDDLLKHFTDSGRKRHRKAAVPAGAGAG